MIPKILHYCWFGGTELPELEASCVATWNDVMPDYEIRRWDESNFDVNSCAFVHEAYEQKMFAFVSDYARYVILRDNGGIFLDTDVKLLKPFDDLLSNNGFCGYMQDNEHVNPGLVLACKPQLSLFSEVVSRYESLHFSQSENRINPLSSPRVLTKLLTERYGLKCDGSYQELDGGFIVYPSEYFDPLDSHTGVENVTNNTYSVHLYSGTWLSPAKKYRVEMRKRLAPKIGPRLSWFISSALSVLKYGKHAF